MPLLQRLLSSLADQSLTFSNFSSIYILDSSPSSYKPELSRIFHEFSLCCSIDACLLHFSPRIPPFTKLLNAITLNIHCDYLQICADDDLYFFDKIDLLASNALTCGYDYLGGLDIR